LLEGDLGLPEVVGLLVELGCKELRARYLEMCTLR
jgi:hypothetical protein